MNSSYSRLLRELAEITSRVEAQRVEARQWYDRQRTAAQRAVDEATDALERAERELVAAREELDRTEAEVAHLWRALRDRLGAGRRVGEPPVPTQGAQADPATLLDGVRDLLDRNRHPGELPSSAQPLLVLCGTLMAAAGYGLGLVARWAGARHGGDLAVGLPVLGLMVTLLGPVSGLVPAKLIADRQRAGLDVRAVTIVLVAGALTTGLLFALIR